MRFSQHLVLRALRPTSPAWRFHICALPLPGLPEVSFLTWTTLHRSCKLVWFFFFFPWARNSTSQSLVTWSFPFDMALNNSLEDTEDLYVEHLKTWVGQNFKRSWRAKRNVLGHYLKYKGKEGTNMKKNWLKKWKKFVEEQKCHDSSVDPIDINIKI